MRMQRISVQIYAVRPIICAQNAIYGIGNGFSTSQEFRPISLDQGLV
jgi:hypothetical protein